MLVVWATSDAQLLRRTIGAALLAMRPETPPHRFEPVTDDPLVAETGEVVLVCGTRPLEVAKKAGLVPKNRALGSLREALFRPKLGGHYQITYDPAITDSEPDKHEIIAWDIRLAARFLKTGSLDPEVGTYRWVGGFSDLIAAINCKAAATGKAVDVSMDTETEGLYTWYKDKQIVSIGFTCEAGKADCLYAGPYDDPRIRDRGLFIDEAWPISGMAVLRPVR